MVSELTRVLKDRDPAYGGVSVLTTGDPGCGKSNALASIALKDFKKGNIVMWRGKNTCQWSILTYKTKKLKFWFKEGLTYKLIKRIKKKNSLGKKKYSSFKYFGKVETYKDEKDLINRVDNEYINIIQTTPHSTKSNAQTKEFIREWIDILDEMISRFYDDPITLIYDEYEDFAPAAKKGTYRLVNQVGDIQKELRKHDIHFFGATHKVTEIFHVVLNKIPWMIYMKGARPRAGSRVYRKSTMKLKAGEAIIDGQRFTNFKFKFVGQAKKFTSEIHLPQKTMEKFQKEDDLSRKLEEREIELSYNTKGNKDTTGGSLNSTE